MYSKTYLYVNILGEGFKPRFLWTRPRRLCPIDTSRFGLGHGNLAATEHANKLEKKIVKRNRITRDTSITDTTPYGTPKNNCMTHRPAARCSGTTELIVREKTAIIIGRVTTVVVFLIPRLHTPHSFFLAQTLCPRVKAGPNHRPPKAFALCKVPLTLALVSFFMNNRTSFVRRYRSTATSYGLVPVRC